MFKAVLGVLLTATQLPLATRAATVTFEGVVDTSGEQNVNPQHPYSEAGFLFAPTNDHSAIFGGMGNITFPGDSTSYFGFAGLNSSITTNPNNPISVTRLGGGLFSLTSLFLGPTSESLGMVDTISLKGFSGARLVAQASFSGAAQTATTDFFNVDRVVISASTDSAIDNLVFGPPVAVPAPSLTVALPALGVLALTRRRRKT